MKTKKLAENIWMIHGGIEPTSNIYLITEEMPMLIDLGNKTNIKETLKSLELIGYGAKDIKKIVFTHLHFDHIGQPSIFKNAKFYASKDEIISYNFAPIKTTIMFWGELNKIKLNRLNDRIDNLEVIDTPGHTRGSICLYYREKRVLFSGDTLFNAGGSGRTDCPTSVPSKMQESLAKLLSYPYEILCPGH